MPGFGGACVGAVWSAVGLTPGKAKHFQMLNVYPSLHLCDCPGRAVVRLSWPSPNFGEKSPFLLTDEHHRCAEAPVLIPN